MQRWWLLFLAALLAMAASQLASVEAAEIKSGAQAVVTGEVQSAGTELEAETADETELEGRRSRRRYHPHTVFGMRLPGMTASFRRYCQRALPRSKYMMLVRHKFKSSAFEQLTRAQLRELYVRAPKYLRTYLKRMITNHVERFSPEPADREFLDARLKTRRRPYRLRSKHQVANLKKALYTSDVSHTNPYEDPYKAPGGPNEGVNRRIGAYIPPKDLREHKGKFKPHCNPLIDRACAHHLPKPGSHEYAGAADPDRIEFAPRYHTVKNPYLVKGSKLRKIKAPVPDPYNGPTEAARHVKIEMLARSNPHIKGFDPANPRNFLPVDNKVGPKAAVQAPMQDPMPPLSSESIRSKVRRHRGGLVTKRQLELDPYARVSNVLRPHHEEYKRKSNRAPLPPPSSSRDKANFAGPGNKAVLRGELVSSRRRRGQRDNHILDNILDSRLFSNPDVGTRPMSDPTQGKNAAPISTIRDRRDPMSLPGDSVEPEPVYLKYPRGSENLYDTFGAFPDGPLSYDRSTVPPPPTDRVLFYTRPWTATPTPPLAPLGPPRLMPMPSEDKAFDFDGPTIRTASPYQEAAIKESDKYLKEASKREQKTHFTPESR